MEFFNYDYCSLLHKNNEVDKLNILIGNIKKEIDTRKHKLEDNIQSYIKKNYFSKYKQLNTKYMVIKSILQLHKTKKIIQSNTNQLNFCNQILFQNQSLQFALHKCKSLTDTGYYLNNMKYYKLFDVYINKLNNGICKQANVSNNLSYYKSSIFIDNIHYSNLSYKQNLNFYIAAVKNKLCKNNIKIMNIQFNELLNILNKYNSLESLNKINKSDFYINLIDIDNTIYINLLYEHNIYLDAIQQILNKILQYDKIISINRELKSFFKIKLELSNDNKKINKEIKQLIKNNNTFFNNSNKLLKHINCNVQLFTKIFQESNQKRKDMRTVINKFENKINSLKYDLYEYNSKIALIKNDLDGMDKIKCPSILKNKLISIDASMNITCCICLNIITTGVKTSCNHIFHIHCINVYIYSIINNNLNNNINITCPLCRSCI